MKKLLKIIVFTLLLLLLLLYYAIYTESGKKLSLNILGFIATQKIGLHTKVSRVDLNNYPYMEVKLLIAKKYNISIDGYYEDKKFDLHYTLTSKYIQSDAYKLKNDVNITGTIKGPRKRLLIDGQGTALDGNISYRGVKYKHAFKDIDINMEDINSSKLFRLLGQKAIFDGVADGYLHFDILSHKERKGLLRYAVTDKDYHGLTVNLESEVNIDNEKHTFAIKVRTPTARLNLIEGKYNQKTKKASAVYQIDIENVSDLKKLLKVKYDAPFYAVGKLNYAAKKIHMQGFSKSLGGTLDLLFKKNQLHFYLTQIPIAPLLKKLNASPPFDSNLSGVGVYDIKSKEVMFKGTLSALKLKQSKVTESLKKSSDIDLSQERFDNNYLQIKTVDGELFTTLLLKNDHNHLYLQNIFLNTHNNSVRGFVDLKMYTYYLKGKLYFKVDKYTDSHDTFINFDGKIQKHYALTLNGLVNQKWVSMDYTLQAARLPSHICTIVDDVNLTGHVNGLFKRLHIAGHGTALNGKVDYKAVQVGNKIEEVKIKMQNIHAQKLSTLLGHPELPSGKVDLNASFEIFSKQNQIGELHYILKKSKLFKLPFTLDTHVKVENEKQTFTANITLADAKIKLDKGTHHLKSKKSKAFYTLDVKELSRLHTLLGYNYQGAFYAVGEVNYDGNYSIHGLSKTFDGLTEFHYDKNLLDINLSKVSFKRIMQLFPYPAILDASTTGRIEYDFNKERLRVNSKLKDAKFSYIEEMDTLYQKADINLLKETFTNSSLNLKYQNKEILANLIMENETSHLSLTNTHIDTKHNTINAFFDIKMQGQEFTGKLYGPLKKPKINLNMQKLIRHEMDRQLDSLMGEGNRKLMENMPMGNTAKDMASGMGGAFMGIFF